MMRAGALLLSVAGLCAASVALAQPAPAPVPPAGPAPGPAPAASPALIAPPPPTPTQEAPPPATTVAPAPVVTPPMDPSEVKPAPAPAKPSGPPRRARFDVAVVEALDKVTAEHLRFEAEVGKPVRYKSLVFTVRACERSMADEPVEDSIAYLTIDSQPRPAPGKPTPPARQAFKGWMYASSPALNPLQHPVYDAWLISCRAKAPATPPAPSR